jgi:hypothetical protein
MNEFKLREIGLAVFVLKDIHDKCKINRTTKAKPAEYFRGRALTWFRRAAELCRELKLDRASEQLKDIVLHYKLSNDEVDYSTICADLRRAIDALLHDLARRTFIEVRPQLTSFVDNKLLFGEQVSKEFPSAVPDIREAGNCLAVECADAAIFHLMRVAEYGLRALAHDRRIKLDKNKPIDLATWEDLLKKLEAAESAIQNFPRTAAREAQFDFFHGANMEVKRFKNKFRNRIMHSRESYEMPEAVSAFGHVKAFMEILASRISERARTPLIWKGSKWIEKS